MGDIYKDLGLSKTVNASDVTVYVNGVKAGAVWHGRHVYDVAKLLRPGKNELKLVLTTTLGNYMLSLKENPTMVKWSNFKYKQVVNPCGLTWGPDLYRD